MTSRVNCSQPCPRVYSIAQEPAHLHATSTLETPHVMAYSLADPYRPLRVVFRINGLIIGLSLGMLLLFATSGTMERLGMQGAPVTPLRVAGVALIGAGFFLLGNSAVREMDLPQLVPCMVFHLLLAVVLILGWFSQDLAGLTLFGQILLVVVFLLCLIGTLAPMRYFGAEYRF